MSGKQVLMGVTALSFSYLIARKYLQSAAAAVGTTTGSGSGSGSGNANANSNGNASAPVASAAAIVVATATPAGPSSNGNSGSGAAASSNDLPPVGAAGAAGAPPLNTLSRANSLSVMDDGKSTPTTPTAREPIDQTVRAAIKAEAKNMQNPLVVVGPSGVGKGTLLGLMLKEFPDHFAKTISHTTREPRKGEVNGQHYHFVTIDQMKKDIADHKFVESCVVHGKLYGTSLQSVHDVAQTGKICILEIDIQGAEKIHSLGQLKANYMFIHPPSVDTLVERLQTRGTETEEAIAVRIQSAKNEISRFNKVKFFNLQITNNNLEQAYHDFRESIIKCYPHLRASANDDSQKQRLITETLEHVERLRQKKSSSNTTPTGAGAATAAAGSAAAPKSS